MNRLHFYLAGCCMMFGDMVFLASFVLTSWVEVHRKVGMGLDSGTTVASWCDGEIVEYGLWRTCVHQYYLDGRTICSGVELSAAAASLMCISLVALLGSAILYIILWLRINKFVVLGTVCLQLLAGVMCSIALALAAGRKRDLSRHDPEGNPTDVSELAIGFWLATSSCVVILLSSGLICVSIFIREPFPNAQEQAAAQQNQEADPSRHRVRPRDPRRNLSSRNSMISDSQTDFSSSSFGSASALPSIGTSSLPSSSLREAAGMSVSDFDIRLQTTIFSLDEDFADDFRDGVRPQDIQLHSIESLDRSSNLEQTTDTTNIASSASSVSPAGEVTAGRRYARKGDDNAPFATSHQASNSDDECTVDRVVTESRQFTRSDLNLLNSHEGRAGRVNGARRSRTSPR